MEAADKLVCMLRDNDVVYEGSYTPYDLQEDIARAIDAAIAKEREECAKVCDESAAGIERVSEGRLFVPVRLLQGAAATIRARTP